MYLLASTAIVKVMMIGMEYTYVTTAVKHSWGTSTDSNVVKVCAHVCFVRVRVCVCTRTCVCVCVCTRTCVCVDASLCVHMCVHVFLCVYVCVHMHTRLYACVCMPTCTCICAH